MLADVGRNGLVDGFAALVTHVGLLDTTLTELTGGSPAYARKAITETAGASGQGSNNAGITFDVPAGATVAAVTFRSALTAGTEYAWWPVDGASPASVKLCTVDSTDVSNDTITSPSHGLTDTQRVVCVAANAGSLPGGLGATTFYYVVSATTDTFKVSLTSGGAAVNITSSGVLFVARCTPEVFASQGTYTFNANAIVYDARLI